MWNIRLKLETYVKETRSTIKDREAGIELKRDAVKRRIEEFRAKTRKTLIGAIDKTFVGVVGNMEKAMNRLAAFLNRGVKIDYSIDAENSTIMRDWVQ